MTDVLVVGGGPSGLATAIACRAEGLEVRVLDRRRPPLDKACGEGLMPDGVASLEALGVRLDPERQHPFQGIRWIDGDPGPEDSEDSIPPLRQQRVAEGHFPGSPGLGIRRLDLHRALIRRAEETGVRLDWGTSVQGLDGDGLATSSGRLSAPWIVGADGLRSRMRTWLGLGASRIDGPRRRGARFGVRRHYRLAPWSPFVEVTWVAGCEAYVTPVAHDEIGVAFLWSGEKGGFDHHLERFPDLARRIEGAEVVSRDRGAGPLRQKARRVALRRGAARFALVGDAAGYVDAITGEGLSLAFHQAQALAKAIHDDDAPAYARACRRLARLPDALTHLLLFVERWPRLRRRVLRALHRDPELFSRILAIHCRAVPWHHRGWNTVPRLVWGVL